MTSSQFINLLELNGFVITKYEFEGETYAKLYNYTNRGVRVNMDIKLTVKSFKSYVRSYDVESVVNLYRKDAVYRNEFSRSESILDFTEYHEMLCDIIKNI